MNLTVRTIMCLEGVKMPGGKFLRGHVKLIEEWSC